MVVRIEAATAHAAFFGPRRLFSRRNCALKYQPFLRLAAMAHWTSMVLSHWSPFRNRVDRRLPALSSLHGHNPAHDKRCPAVGNRLMSGPISARITRADNTSTPGIVIKSKIRL